ncbi:hypothetical protein FOZ63_022354, partial [Perkinsus olseni]
PCFRFSPSSLPSSEEGPSSTATAETPGAVNASQSTSKKRKVAEDDGIPGKSPESFPSSKKSKLSATTATSEWWYTLLADSVELTSLAFWGLIVFKHVIRRRSC